MNSWDNPTRPVLSMNMDGGRACLDLLNTLIPAIPAAHVARAEPASDLLKSYTDFVALAVRTAILSSEEATTLLALSAKDPEAEGASLNAAKRFRDLLRRLLVKNTREAAPATRDLASFEELRARARSFEVLVWEDGRFSLRSRYLAEGLSAPLYAFIRNADELLRSPDLSRVRVVRRGSPDARFILG